MDVYAVCGMRYYILVVISCECILSSQIRVTMQNIVRKFEIWTVDSVFFILSRDSCLVSSSHNMHATPKRHTLMKIPLYFPKPKTSLL